jgi:hypothetical protein
MITSTANVTNRLILRLNESKRPAARPSVQRFAAFRIDKARKSFLFDGP